jgi:hypothetical protein
LFRERRFQNPGEEFFVTLSERFLNGIVGVDVHQAVMLIPARRRILQGADVV